jgi:integrase
MPLRLYLRGETWHYRGTVAGRRLRGSTGVSRQNKETAQHVVAELEARAWKGHLHGPGSILTFAQAALIYRAARKPTRYLERVEDFWKDTPVKEITAGRVRSSCLALYPVAKGATWNRAVIVPTQAIINHAAEQELCPRITVKRWPVSRTDRRPASWEWVKAFMSASSPHLRALACFMFLTGARIGEAVTLSWSDVRLSEARALIRSTKTKTERWGHLPHALIIALANLPGDRHPDTKVFGFANRFAAEREWKKVVIREGLEPLTPHCCRHGFATGLLQAGVDPITVAKLGGWASPEHVFRTYGHASEDKTLTDRLTHQGHSKRQATDKKRLLG